MALFGSGRGRCRENGLSLPKPTWPPSDRESVWKHWSRLMDPLYAKVSVYTTRPGNDTRDAVQVDNRCESGRQLVSIFLHFSGLRMRQMIPCFDFGNFGPKFTRNDPPSSNSGGIAPSVKSKGRGSSDATSADLIILRMPRNGISLF